tara:strand:+ start:1322 stop:1558 length:237 start_codon:yes stop_codon:yes gene_type:complete
MDASQIYILISIIIFVIVAIIILSARKKKRKPLSKLTIIALFLILAGTVFVQDRIIGSGLIGVGVALAMIDIKNKSKS